MTIHDIRIISLYSGSTGNSFLLSTPNTTILIDAGKNYKKLNEAMEQVGFSIDQITAILLTHEHGDHTSALPVLQKKHPLPLYVPESCVEKLLSKCDYLENTLISHAEKTQWAINEVQITSFPTPHDSYGSVGYLFEIPTDDGVFTIGYATDLGYVNEETRKALLKSNAVVLESNHDIYMLQEGPYPQDLKDRISSRFGHLSNDDCAAFASELYENGTRYFLLAHLSQENNIPEIAYMTTKATIGENANIYIANPIMPIEMKL